MNGGSQGADPPRCIPLRSQLTVASVHRGYALPIPGQPGSVLHAGVLRSPSTLLRMGSVAADDAGGLGCDGGSALDGLLFEDVPTQPG
jgi:hypothetical protein